MEAITFTAGIKKFAVKSTDTSPEFSIELSGITGLSNKAEDLIASMNGAVIVTLKQAQSSLKFGEKPEGAKVESPADLPKSKSKIKPSKKDNGK